MPPAPKGLGEKRAIVFHVNDDALLPITETLTSRSIRTITEHTVRDLKKTLRTEPPEYLIIGAGYLISRAPTLLFSLTKEFRYIPIILTVTEGERDACQTLLGDAVSAHVMEPYHSREVQFALLTADRTSSGRMICPFLAVSGSAGLVVWTVNWIARSSLTHSTDRMGRWAAS